MPFSFHSHSGQFCLHAEGTLESIVQNAIKIGYTHLGLSEHMPRLEARHLYEEESHLTPDDLQVTFDAYVSEARRLQVKYANQINILVGMETEYIDPSYLSFILSLTEKHKLDYTVGSIHHACDLPIDFSQETFDKVVADKGFDRLVDSYLDNQYDLLVSVQPQIIGHFDVIFKYVQDPVLGVTAREKLTRNIDCGIEYGGIFEINSAAFGYSKADPYPRREFLQEIIDKGGKVTISDDAHGPLAVGQYYGQLYNFLKDMNISKLTYLEYNHMGKTVEEKCLNNALACPIWKSL